MKIPPDVALVQSMWTSLDDDGAGSIARPTRSGGRSARRDPEVERMWPSILIASVCAPSSAWSQETAARDAPLAPRVLWTVPLDSTSFGGGAVADANGDGVLDVAFACYFGDSRIRVLSGRDGAELWSVDAAPHPGQGDACLDASCRFADVNGDGRLELIVPVSNTSQVLALDAATGAKAWTYEAGLGACIDSPPWIGTIDGAMRVVVGTFQGTLHVIDGRTGAGVRTVRIVDKGAVQSGPVVMDLDGDGHDDYLATSFNGDGRIVAVTGAPAAAPPEGTAPGAPAATTDRARELWHVQTESTMLYHGPSVGDLDGDGRADFAIGAYDGRVRAFRADGTPLWTTPKLERYVMSPTAIADLDGDGTPEVIVASDAVTVLRGADGSTLWSVPFAPTDAGWSVTRGVAIADLDGDGRPDLCALNGRGRFKAFRGADGAVLAEFEAAALCARPIATNSHVPLIADLDGDGMVDVFFVVGHGDARSPGEGAGVAVCLTGFAGRATTADGSPNGWFMHRHDPHNTGNMATPLAPHPAAGLTN